MEIMKLHANSACVLAFALLLTFAGTGLAQEDTGPANDEPVPAAAPPDDEAASDSPASSAATASPAAGDELAIEQARLADRYKRLEEILSQLAELSAATDPNRARILRQAIAQSREQDINVRFESIVKLLEDE